jgi:hypothetical protein
MDEDLLEPKERDQPARRRGGATSSSLERSVGGTLNEAPAFAYQEAELRHWCIRVTEADLQAD